jgi:hypothetical protein
MADTNNPFAMILSPEALEAQREAEAMSGVNPNNPWEGMAAKAGLSIRKLLVQQGLGNAEDRKASANQAIMQGSQRKFADFVQNEGMDADDAQAAVLEDAIAQFSANGNYEQALALTQPLQVLRTQKLERGKLKAETTNLEAKPALSEAQTQAALAQIETRQMMAQAAADRAQAQIQASQNNAELQAGRLALAASTLELKQAQFEALKAGGGLKQDSTFYQKMRFEADDHVLAAGQAADLMANVSRVARSNPGAMTDAGAWASMVGGLASSARAAMQGAGYDLGNEDQKVMTTLQKYNVNDSMLQSSALDLAYAFARVRDPGGRLSNQDVNMAIDIVRGKGDPVAMLATLKQNYKKLTKDTDNFVKVRQNQGIVLDPIGIDVYTQAKAEADAAILPPKSAPAPASAGRRGQPAAPAAAPAAGQVPQFATEAEAAAAGLPDNTKVVIGGVPGTWRN